MRSSSPPAIAISCPIGLPAGRGFLPRYRTAWPLQTVYLAMISLINDAAIHYISMFRAVLSSAGKLNTRNADRRYHRSMSETPPIGHPSAPGPAGFPPGSPPAGPWGPPGPFPVSRPARWPMFVMLVITLVAVGAAVAAWLRPIPHSTSATPAAPSYSEQQAGDAKSNVCSAYAKIHHAVDTNAQRNGGDDPTAQLAVAVNMRQVYVIGSAYLFTTLANEPATPEDLAAPIRKAAGLFQVLTLEGLSSDSTTATLNAINETGTTIESLCK